MHNLPKYEPDRLVIRTPTRTVVIDRKYENVKALVEGGWTLGSNPKPGPEPTVEPILYWNQRDDGPPSPHPGYNKMINRILSERRKKPNYEEKAFAGVTDPLMSTDIPPLAKGMKSVDDIIPKWKKVQLIEKKIFEKHNPGKKYERKK